MRVLCQQEELHRVLGYCSRAVSRKSTLPVLANVLLTTDQGKLKVAATNLEIAITAWIDASIEEEGSVTVRADLLTDFVASLPSEQVTLQLERASMTLGVQAGRSKAHVKGIAAEDFPAIATISETSPATQIDPTTFREMIAQVAFAAATDDSRPVLAGVLAEFSGSSLSLAAADGFRLSLRRAELSSPVTEELSIIIPARALQELSRIIGDQSDPIDLAVTPQQSQLLIRSGSIEFMTRLIDGHFPDVRRIIPDQYQTRVILNRDAFLAAARRARLFAESNNDVVKIEMTPGDGDLDPGFATVSAQAAETGDNEDYLEARVEGEQMQIAFNSRYLTDVLSVLRGTEVSLEMKGTNSAGVFKPAGDAEFTHVIMPIVMG